MDYEEVRRDVKCYVCTGVSRDVIYYVCTGVEGLLVYKGILQIDRLSTGFE